MLMIYFKVQCFVALEWAFYIYSEIGSSYRESAMLDCCVFTVAQDGQTNHHHWRGSLQSCSGQQSASRMSPKTKKEVSIAAPPLV